MPCCQALLKSRWICAAMDCRVKPGNDKWDVVYNSRALLNENDDTRRVFSSRIKVRVNGGSAR